MLRFVKRVGFDFSFRPVGFTRCGLCQGEFTVEVRLLFGAEFEGHAASRGDSLEHRKRVPGVLGILQPGDHGLQEQERFLSTQADHFTGVKWEEEVGLLRSQ